VADRVERDTASGAKRYLGTLPGHGRQIFTELKVGEPDSEQARLGMGFQWHLPLWIR